MPISRQEYYLTSSRTEKNDSSNWPLAPFGTVEGEFDADEICLPVEPEQRRAIVEGILGPIEWEGPLHGHCTCPGEYLHTSPTRSNHCRVHADERPNIHCFHTSCRPAREAANWELRRNLPPLSLEASPKIGLRCSTSGGRLRQIEAKAKGSLPAILADYSLPEEGIASAIAATSPIVVPDDPHKQTGLFLGTMFTAEDVVWIGRKFDSGKPHHQRNFRSVADWLSSGPFKCEFTCASTFKPGSCCRRDADVAQRRYIVVESDGLSFGQTAGVFRFLKTLPDWRLRAVVYSGGKSLHGWFDGAPLTWSPAELAAFICGLSCDQATLRASQPVRLAGVRRADTGHNQSLLYLSPAAHTL